VVEPAPPALVVVPAPPVVPALPVLLLPLAPGEPAVVPPVLPTPSVEPPRSPLPAVEPLVLAVPVLVLPIPPVAEESAMLPVSLVLLPPVVVSPPPPLVDDSLPLPQAPSSEALRAKAARASWNFAVRIKKGKFKEKLWLGIRWLVPKRGAITPYIHR